MHAHAHNHAHDHFVPIPQAPIPVKTVGDQVAAVIARYATRLFGLPGGTISPVFDAAEGAGLEIVATQHECAAVFMATGEARASDGVGVVAVTSGPGLLNTINGLAAAREDESPLVLLVGDVRRSSAGRGALQDGSALGLDARTILRPVTKAVHSPQTPEQAIASVESAFREAREGRAGPVVVILPVDVGRAEIEESATRLRARTTLAAIDDTTATEIAHALRKARRPMVLVGIGGREDRALAQVLITMAETMAVPVATDAEGKGVFPESHPLSLGVFGVGGSALSLAYAREADVVVTVGARLDDTTTLGYDPVLRPRDGLLVQLDSVESRLGRSYRADLSAQGNLAASCTRIAESAPLLDLEVLGRRRLALTELRRRHPERVVRELKAMPFDPRDIPAALQDAYGPQAVFTSDIGNHLLFALSGLVVDRRDGFFVSHGTASMGSGIITAMGLQLGFGMGRPVVAICGDGGMLMVGNDLATCARYGIPVTFAVFRDGSLGMVQQGFSRLYGRSPDFTLPPVDLIGWAQSLGARAIRIESQDQLRRVAAEPYRGPTLLELPVDPTIAPTNPRVDVCAEAT